MNIYEQRWAAAKEWVRNFKEIAKQYGCQHVCYEGEMYPLENLTVTEDSILMRMGEHCVCQHFENNREYDHGLYTPIKETIRKFEESFELYQKIEIKKKRK